MTPEQREAVRDIVEALHFALIEHDREIEERRRSRPKMPPPVSAAPKVKVQLRPEEIVEDVQWLIESREHPRRIARRLNKSPATLARWLHRHGRHDLAAHFERQEVSA